MTTVDDVSRPSRLAEPDEAISGEELQLAARNHAMPLEALRYDVTPAGLHYLLIHYDIPDVDPAAHTLTVDGAVDRPLILDLAALQERPRVARRVTLECAGNGRALLHPRPVSQPWLVEAVGNAEWTGSPLAPLLREAGLSPDAVDVVFTGADHGVERGVEQDYQRALPVADALREEVLLAYEMNGAPLLRAAVEPGWLRQQPGAAGRGGGPGGVIRLRCGGGSVPPAGWLSRRIRSLLEGRCRAFRALRH